MESTTFENSANNPRVRELLSQGVRCLAAAGIESARLDAEVLLGHVLAKTREIGRASCRERVYDDV